MQENTSSAAQLWCDMMNFYTAVFNFDDLVISIRQLNPLYKIDKGWGKSNIAIEDPFNLDHNLGAGVSEKSLFWYSNIDYMIDNLSILKQWHFS